MKSYTLLCFFLSLAMIICPLCSVKRATDVISNEFFKTNGGEFGEGENLSDRENGTVKVMSGSTQNITEMDLREYLIGAVAAEMSPAYHEEALKAQTVASHTMLLYSKEHKSADLKGADISDSSQTHQGYISTDAQQEKWGDNYKKYREKIERCVDEVIKITVEYNGEPIAAAFHAISNGNTENATDVWGGDYPYLVSVKSEGDKLSPEFSSEVSVTRDEFKAVMEKQGAVLEGDPSEWLREIKRTPTDMVKEIAIGGKTFTGREIRGYFSLKSSTFNCAYKDDGFIFTVSGYGHGVGMSQYGADFMARQGFSYKEILKHYYKGVALTEQ